MKNIKLGLRIAIAIAGAILLFSSADATEKEKADRKPNPNTAKLLAIGAWQGRITYGADYDGPMTPGSSDLYVKASRTVTGTGKLTHPAIDADSPASDGNRWMVGSPGGSLSGSATIKDEVGSRTLGKVRSLDAGGGLKLVVVDDEGAEHLSEMELSIDEEADTYSIALSVDVRGKEWESALNDGKGGTRPVWATDGIVVDEIPLPTSGTTLSGSKTVDYYFFDILRPATVSWNFSPTAPLESRLTIEPESVAGYEKWIPAPKSDEKQTADSIDYGSSGQLGFKVTVEPKKKGVKPIPTRIDFRLTDVSRHKGKCTNYPKTGGEKDDLRFVKDQPGLVIDDDLNAHTEKEVLSAVVLVEAMDTGAYGRIEAKPHDSGDAAEYEKTGKHFVTIPFDENKNDVADAWEKKAGVGGKNYDAKWDEDPQPAKQRRNGDGYTLYEEYRGFVVDLGAPGATKKAFLRTDPRKKDLFFRDKDGLVRKHYAGLNPSKCELHIVDDTMMSFSTLTDAEHRRVNMNSTAAHSNARQYAVDVVSRSWPKGSDAYGEAMTHVQGEFAAFREPLKNHYVVEIYPAAIESATRGAFPDQPAARTQLQEAILETTVRHEIGHGIGIRHHVAGELKREAARQENDLVTTLGVPTCIMRNETSRESAQPWTMSVRNRYCGKNEAWSLILLVGEKPNITEKEYNSTTSDDCFGQIDVKSDP